MPPLYLAPLEISIMEHVESNTVESIEMDELQIHTLENGTR